MGFSFYVLVCSLVVSSGNAALNNLVYRKTGNLSITAIFGDPEMDCNLEAGRVLEEIAAAIWTIEALNNYHFLPGITIGLSAFKICGEKFEDKKNSLKLTEEELLHNEAEYNIGFLTTEDIFAKLRPSDRISKQTVRVQHIADANTLVDLVVELLANLQWMRIDLVVADSENLLNSISEKMSDEGICICEELLITNSSTHQGSNLTKAKDSGVIVVVASFNGILKITEKAKLKNGIKLLLIPTDFLFAPISGLPTETMVLLPSMKDGNVLTQFIQDGDYHRDFFNHKEPVKSPLFVGIADGILKLLNPFKKIRDEYCDSHPPCFEFMDFLRENKTVLRPPESMPISSDDIIDVLNQLKIDPSSNDEMFLFISSLTIANGSEEVAIFEIYSVKTRNFRPILLMIDDDLLTRENKSRKEIEDKEFDLDVRDRFKQQKTDSGASLIRLVQSLAGHSGNLTKADRNHSLLEKTTVKPLRNEACDLEDGSNNTHMCRNFVRNLTVRNNGTENNGSGIWRFLTWVSINTSVGFIGVMCTLSIMFFIISRICKGDVLEGSPYFTLLLMLSVILTFGSSLPFHVELPANNSLLPLICGLRINGPPLAYSSLFSLLLSRSLMLASSESGDGFVSHVNGYLQSVLCFFMFGVEISLTSQRWPFYEQLNCSGVHAKHAVIFALGYSSFLLALLACVSPFIIRSKRNYKEGMFFSISVFFIVVAWSAWISFYFLLAEEQRDAAVAIGLNATATVLLVCIFIPRTYLMAAGIVRDRTARSLPSLERDILSRSNDNYKSDQTLNHAVFGTITYRSSDVGMTNPILYSSRTAYTREAGTENLNRETGQEVSSITP